MKNKSEKTEKSNQKEEMVVITSQLTGNDTVVFGDYMPYEVGTVSASRGKFGGLYGERFRVDVTPMDRNTYRPKTCYALKEHPEKRWGLFEIKIVDYEHMRNNFVFGYSYELNDAHNTGRQVARDLALKISKEEGLPVVDMVDDDLITLRKSIKDLDESWENDPRHPKNNFNDGGGI